MRGFVLRFLITMLGLYVASSLLPGVSLASTGTFMIAALLLGFVNAIVRPVLFLLTLPLTVLTLGLFLFVLNGIMFALVAALLPGFEVAGFGSAILGALLVSLTSMVASWFIGDDGRYEVIIVERRR